MNKNKIHELAERAGLLGPSSRVGNAHEAAEKFANLIVAECAKACEPARKEWVGLTDEQINTEWRKWITNESTNKSYTLAIEAKLKELNND